MVVIAVIATQAGEIEPEHDDALSRQGSANGSHGSGVSATGKAVDKEPIGVRL